MINKICRQVNNSIRPFTTRQMHTTPKTDGNPYHESRPNNKADFQTTIQVHCMNIIYIYIWCFHRNRSITSTCIYISIFQLIFSRKHIFTTVKNRVWYALWISIKSCEIQCKNYRTNVVSFKRFQTISIWAIEFGDINCNIIFFVCIFLTLIWRFSFRSKVIESENARGGTTTKKKKEIK